MHVSIYIFVHTTYMCIHEVMCMRTREYVYLLFDHYLLILSFLFCFKGERIDVHINTELERQRALLLAKLAAQQIASQQLAVKQDDAEVS